jgi:hypothetical protein
MTDDKWERQSGKGVDRDGRVTLFLWKNCDLSEDRIRCRTPNHTESLSRTLLNGKSIPASQVQETDDEYPGLQTDNWRRTRHILTGHTRSKKHAGWGNYWSRGLAKRRVDFFHPLWRAAPGLMQSEMPIFRTRQVFTRLLMLEATVIW